MSFLEQLIDAADKFFQGRVRTEEVKLQLQENLRRRQLEEEELQRKRKLEAMADAQAMLQDVEKYLENYITPKKGEAVRRVGEQFFVRRGEMEKMGWAERLKSIQDKEQQLRTFYKTLFGKSGEKFIDDILKGNIFEQVRDPAKRRQVEMLFGYLYGDKATEELQKLMSAQTRFQEEGHMMLKGIDDFIQDAKRDIEAQLVKLGYNISDPRVQQLILSRLEAIRQAVAVWAGEQLRGLVESRPLLEPLALMQQLTKGGSR